MFECLNLIFKIHVLANIEYSKHSATDINLLWWIQLASESGIQ